MLRFAIALIPIWSIFAPASASEANYLSADALANIIDIGGGNRGAVSVSPNGKWIAFQLQTPDIPDGNYKLSWMVVSAIPGGDATFIADGGDINLNPYLFPMKDGLRFPTKASWSPDSKRFAYTLKKDGQVQIWLSRAQRRGQTQLTRGPRDVIDFIWSRDGEKLYYQTGMSQSDLVNQFAEEKRNGFLFDDRFIPMVSRKIVTKACQGSSNSEPVKVIGLQRECNQSLWVYEFKSKKERLATEGEIAEYQSLRKGASVPELSENSSVLEVRVWEEGAQYAWLQNEDPDIYKGSAPLHRIFASINGRTYRCEAAQCLRQGGVLYYNMPFWRRENGDEIVFVKRKGDRHSGTGLYAWKPLTGNIRTIYESEDWLSDCAPSGDSLICLHESHTQPRKIVSLSLESGRMETIYDANPEFSQYAYTKVEKLEWTDKFGQPTHGHLVYPKNHEPGRRYPLILVTYQSRGFLRGGVGDEYPVHPFAAEGFFVLSHAAPFSLEVFAKSQNVADEFETGLHGFRGILSSQEAAVSALIERGLVDPARVAITGFSNGARQTNFALINSDLFTVGIQSGGGSNPSTYYLMTSKGREDQRRWKGGPPEDHNSELKNISLALAADKIEAPILINASDHEIVPTVEGVVRLQDAGKPVEMYVFPDAYHNKWRPDQRLAIYRRNIQWLKFWLMNEEEHAPVSPDQYERWRTMRDSFCAEMKAEKKDLPVYCQ